MPFEFLSLPQEVQDMIYKYCVACDSLMVKLRPGTFTAAAVYFEDVPSLLIELVCPKINKDVKQMRSQLWPRTLRFDARAVRLGAVDRVGSDDKYTWLHHHIQQTDLYAGFNPRQSSGFKFWKLQRFTVFGQYNWLARRSCTSLAAMRYDVSAHRSLLRAYAHRYHRYVGTLSNAPMNGSEVTTVCEAPLKNSGCIVEIRVMFKFFRNGLKASKLYHACTKLFVEGREIEA